MIASLTGVLAHKSPQYLIVDVHGIGFQVYASLHSYYQLPEVKESVFLHTYTHLREDAVELYGFLTPVEREAFILLLGVSGIGPRSALNILSGLSVEDLGKAIQSADLRRLTSVPGIGAKTAGRMALELKDKLAALLPDLQVPADAPPADPKYQKNVDDALSALVNLGYQRQYAKEALKLICQTESERSPDKGAVPSVEELIRLSLKHLSK